MKTNEEIEYKLCVTSAIIVEGYLWFCSACYNFLFKCNLTDYKIEDAVEFPVGCAGSPASVVHMSYSNRSIYLFANNANNNLIRYDLDSMSMSLLPGLFGNVTFGNFSDEDVNYIYVSIVDQKKVMLVNKDNLKVEMRPIMCNGTGIQVLKKINNGFAFLETGIGDVVISDENFIEKERITCKPNGFEIAYDNYYPGIGIAYNTEEVTVFPRYAIMVYSVNLSKGTVRQRGERFIKYKNEGDNGPRYSCLRRMNNLNWIFSNEYNCWLIYDDQLKEISKIQMSIASNVKNKMDNINILNTNTKEKLFYESGQIYTLENFINSLTM